MMTRYGALSGQAAQCCQCQSASCLKNKFADPGKSRWTCQMAAPKESCIVNVTWMILPTFCHAGRLEMSGAVQSVYHGFGKLLSYERLSKAGDMGLRDAITQVIDDPNFQVSCISNSISLHVLIICPITFTLEPDAPGSLGRSLHGKRLPSLHCPQTPEGHAWGVAATPKMYISTWSTMAFIGSRPNQQALPWWQPHCSSAQQINPRDIDEYKHLVPVLDFVLDLVH